MASTNAGSKYYVCLPGDSPEYFDVDPNPVPEFEEPERQTKSDQCLVGMDDNDDPTPGQWVHFDGGAHESGKTMQVDVQYVTAATLAAFQAMFFGASTVEFSPDDGTTVHTMMFKSFRSRRDRGRQSFSLSIKFQWISTTTP